MFPCDDVGSETRLSRRPPSFTMHPSALGVFARLVPALVFKTSERSRERLLVGSIPIRSRHTSSACSEAS